MEHIIYVQKKSVKLHYDKRLQAYDGIKTYPYGYKHWESMQNRDAKYSKYKFLILIITQMNINQNIIQSGHILQIIHIEYLLQEVLDLEKQMHYLI